MARLDDTYLAEIRKLPGLNENELFVWHLANQWLQATLSTPAQREAVHMTQLVFIEYCLGPVMNHVTDDERDKWQDAMLDELRTLRTFNGSFLGLLHARRVIDGPTADFYNLLAWYTSLVDVGLRTLSRLVEHRKGGNIELEMWLMGASGVLYSNKLDFHGRFSVGDSHIAFLEWGRDLVEGFDGKASWESYFDEKGSSLLPRMSPVTFDILGNIAAS